MLALKGPFCSAPLLLILKLAVILGRREGLRPVRSKDFVDAVKVVDARPYAGVNDDVLSQKGREGEACRSDERGGFRMVQLQREGERHGGLLRDGAKFVANDRRVGLAAQMRRAVDARGVPAEAVADIPS